MSSLKKVDKNMKVSLSKISTFDCSGCVELCGTCLETIIDYSGHEPGIKKKLMAITRFSALHDAVNLCRYEEAAWQRTNVQKGRIFEQSARLYKRKRDRPTKSCNKCGYQAHSEQITCPAIGKECKTCKKIGHFAILCNASKAAVRLVRSGMRIEIISNGKPARKVPKLSINLCSPE